MAFISRSFLPAWCPGPRDNDASCVLRVSTGDQALLLTGDIEAGVEQALVMADAAGLGSSVVVAAHHGSRSSSSAGFIEAVAPRYVLFSAGAHNRWGFPRVEVEQRWCDGGAVPLNTAVEGAIGFRFTPSSLQGPFLHARRHRRYWQWQIRTTSSNLGRLGTCSENRREYIHGRSRHPASRGTRTSLYIVGSASASLPPKFSDQVPTPLFKNLQF